MTFCLTYSLSFKSKTYSNSESCLQDSTKPYALPPLPSASPNVVLMVLIDPYCSCTHIFDFMINTVLQNRPHVFIINRASFSSFCYKDEHRELHKQWIIRLFESFRVNELSPDYKLSSIFTSLPKFQSLKVLKLNMNGSRLVVNLPKMELASLETLRIESIQTHDSLGEWISQSFPSLKHLFLQEVAHWTRIQDCTIQSSCLEDLTILDFCSFNPVRIITQNLRTLHCYFRPYVPQDMFVPGTCALDLQTLTWVGGSYLRRLRYNEEMFQNLKIMITTSPRVWIIKESNWNVLIQLFKAIRFTRELHIDTQVLKQWVRILRTPMGVLKDLHGQTFNSLEDLRHLEIDVREDIEGDDYITLMERLSNLKTLTLVNDPNVTCGSDFGPHLKELSPRKRFEKASRDCKKVEVRRTKGLKKVKMIIREMSYDMIVVIGWLMKSCIDLKVMSLHYPSCFDRFMKGEGLQYLLSFEGAFNEPPSFKLKTMST